MRQTLANFYLNTVMMLPTISATSPTAMSLTFRLLYVKHYILHVALRKSWRESCFQHSVGPVVSQLVLGVAHMGCSSICDSCCPAAAAHQLSQSCKHELVHCRKCQGYDALCSCSTMALSDRTSNSCTLKASMAALSLVPSSCGVISCAWQSVWQ